MNFLHSSLALAALSLLVLGATTAACSSTNDGIGTGTDGGICGACPGLAEALPFSPMVVTFPCGKPAPAKLATSGSCQLGPIAYEGAPMIEFVTSGVCHVTATFADGTTAEGDVSQTLGAGCCPTYSYTGFTNVGPARELQLGGAPCGDAGFGEGYTGYDDAGSASASDASDGASG
jgi:hypothetical protein